MDAQFGGRWEINPEDKEARTGVKVNGRWVSAEAAQAAALAEAEALLAADAAGVANAADVANAAAAEAQSADTAEEE